jgi:hypothetical protein
MPTIVSREEAIARGLKRYFTGKPCKHGHVAERNVPTRHCLDCRRETNRRPRRHPEKQRENERRYRERNREKTRETARRYRNRHPEKRHEQSRKRRQLDTNKPCLKLSPLWACVRTSSIQRSASPTRYSPESLRRGSMQWFCMPRMTLPLGSVELLLGGADLQTAALGAKLQNAHRLRSYLKLPRIRQFVAEQRSAQIVELCSGNPAALKRVRDTSENGMAVTAAVRQAESMLAELDAPGGRGVGQGHISPGICIVIQGPGGTEIDVTPQPPQIDGEAEDLPDEPERLSSGRSLPAPLPFPRR